MLAMIVEGIVRKKKWSNSKRRSATRAKRSEEDRQKRLEKIKKEIAKSIKEQKEEKIEAEESVDSKVEGVVKAAAKAIVYAVEGAYSKAKGMLGNTYGKFEGNPEDLYLYKSESNEKEYTPLILGENAAELSYKDLDDFAHEAKMEKLMGKMGSGRHITTEKKERYELHKLFGPNLAMTFVRYDMSLT